MSLIDRLKNHTIRGRKSSETPQTEGSKKQDAEREDLNSLSLRRRDDHTYGRNGNDDVFKRGWVLEGKRGRVEYIFTQVTEADGAIEIREEIKVLSKIPVEGGNREMEAAPHPVLRTDHVLTVFKELAVIYRSELPEL